MNKTGGGNPMMDHNDDGDKTKDMTYILTKFLTRGYEALSDEELAVTLINPDFNGAFKKKTGTLLSSRHRLDIQVPNTDHRQASQRQLRPAIHDIKRRIGLRKITNEKFNSFFVNVIKGDLEKIRESFRKFGDDELLRAVDVSKKSPLHHAAREGRTSVADYLITKGFKINARERTLKTPLHYACLFGHAVLAGTVSMTTDLLLKKGADIVAKDSSGRTCFHFACCSWSSETIALVLGLKPELINLGDNIGRTGIHYAVWNSCDSQVDILRTITERGGNINQVDDYGKTALHYAAEGGRARAIPILIQKGANMSIRETRTHKTPLELACDERTRELMIVYSSSPYSLKSKDKSFLDSAIKGQSVVVKKQTIFNEEKIMSKQPSNVPESNLISQRNNSALVSEFWKGKMVEIMTQLQEIGVKSYQHMKRPYLFTGSWLEGITNIEQLYDRVKGITSNEAMLRLFNILHPYEGEFPNKDKEEVAISQFYGEYYNFEVPKETRIDLSSIGNNVIEQNKIAGLQSALELANHKNEDLQNKINSLLAGGKEFEKVIADLKSKYSDYNSLKADSDRIKNLLIQKEGDILAVQKQRDAAENRIKLECQSREETITALSNDVQAKDIELTKLRKELNIAKTQLKLMETKTEDIKKPTGPGSKTLNKFERKRYISQELAEEDQKALNAMMKVLRANPPDLPTRLRNEDKNADGLINSYECLQFLEKLKIGSDEAVALRKLMGFPKYDEIYLDDFVELVMRRSERNQITEKSLLEVFVSSFQNKKITVEQAMSLYDKNSDAEIDISEFKGMTLDLGVKLDDKELLELMMLLDSDNSGLISIAELKSKLKAVETEKNQGKLEDKKNTEIKVNGGQTDPRKEIEPKRLGGMDQERLKKVDSS